jgi:hypothetical protein
VSSVRKRKVLAIDEHGAARDLVASGAGGVGALCGSAVAEGRLWVAMATMPPMEGLSATGPRPTGLLAFDARTGALVDRVDLPEAPAGEAERGHALTDLALAPSGEVFVSDALGGAVYVLRRGAHKLERLAGPDGASAASGESAARSTPEEGLFSPQTPVITPDGKRLLVPDYVRGLAVIDLASGALSFVPHARDVATEGIDDLHLVGHDLLAIQNGTDPVRVALFHMDAALSRIERADVLEQGTPGLGEPTHGVVVGDSFFFIADGGWNRFGDDGTLLSNAPPDTPSVKRLSIPGVASLK